MKVSVTPVIEYESDIKVVDIDLASEEEARLSLRGLKSSINPYSLVSEGPYRGFFVRAVLTFSGPYLKAGSTFSIPETSTSWYVIKENKAITQIRFSPDEYEEDGIKLKAKLHDWAEEKGIRFG